MQISLLNNLLLFLLPLLAVPLLVHLFARSKPPVYRFPAVRFIQKVIRQTQRIRKPRDRWLLLIRTLLAAALLALFLRPVLHLPGAGPKRGGRSVVLLVDATASMNASQGGQSRFATACREAGDLLKDMSSSDRANIIWMRSDPESAFPEPGVHHAYLRDLLKTTTPSLESCDPVAALRQAMDQLSEEKDRHRAVYIFSDFQQSAWQQLDWPDTQGVELIAIPVGNGTLPNAAITSLISSPARPLAGTTAHIHCTVANYSADAISRDVFLAAGSLRLSRTIQVPPFGQSTALFSLPPEQHNSVTCTLPEDAFPYDNQRFLQVHPLQQLRVGIYGSGNEASIWTRVVESLDWTRAIPMNDLAKLAEIDLILLADWENDPEQREAIDNWLKLGHALICAPRQVKALQGWFTAPTEFSSHGRIELSQSVELRIASPEDPLFSLFKNGHHGDPADARFSARLPLPSDIDGQALLAYGDAVPALLRSAHAKVYVWNMPLDQKAGSWAAREEFFVLFAELLQLAHSESKTMAPLDLQTGQVLQLTGQDKNIELLAPNDALWPITEDLGQASGIRYLSSPATRPGFYTWQSDQRQISTDCVNFPAQESDLRLTENTRDLLPGSSVILESGARAGALREGIELWPWLLTAALILIFIELWLMYRNERSTL